MDTIAQTLTEHAVPREEVVRRYPGPAGLVSRILGVVPHAWGLFEIWPPALVTYNLSVPALMDVPKIDVGRGIPSERRAMVAHASSRAFGCRYCTAHTAVMGTVIRGPADRPQVMSRVRAVGSDDSASAADQAAIDYAAAVSAMPPALSSAQLDALHRTHDESEAQAVILVAVVMGFLNRSMDAFGTPLETAVRERAGGPLSQEAGWDAGKHDQGDDPVDAGERITVANRLRMLRELPLAIRYERAALADIPSGLEGQRRAATERLGFAPAYLSAVRSGPARRLLAHWLLARLAAPDTAGGLACADRLRLGYRMATAAGNDRLAAHMALAAMTQGVAVAALDQGDPAVMAAADALSGGAGAVPQDVVDALMDAHGPEGVVETVLTASIVTGLHRLVLSMADLPLEEPVAAFLDGPGASLRLEGA